MGQVSVTNAGEKVLCAMVEPLGEDYWLTAGQTLTFTIPDEVPTVAWYEGGVAVEISSGSCYDFAVTTASGETVACGYQRPGGA